MVNSWPVPPSTGLERVIDDRYRLRNMLGSGGLGEVYFAEDLRIDSSPLVAIKLLQSELLKDAESIEEFSHEALILRRLHHPNIQRLLDFQLKPDIAYLVTEYVPGGSLEDLICPDPDLPPQPLPLEHVDTLFEQIVAAVDYLHSERIIHRDLKPANILLDHKERPILADFSLGAFLNNQMPASLINTDARGTPLYAAPELWDDQAGKASDIYALGIILFKLISGQTPFQGTPEELKKQHRFALIPALSEVAPGLDYPPELDNLFLAALAKDPVQRIATAKELYRRFKAILTAAADNSGQKSPVGVAVPVSTTGGWTGSAGWSSQAAAPVVPTAVSSGGVATPVNYSSKTNLGPIILPIGIIILILFLVPILSQCGRQSVYVSYADINATATVLFRKSPTPDNSGPKLIVASQAHKDAIRGLSWYLPGSLAFYSGSEDRTLRAWTLLDNKIIEGPLVKESYGISALAVSPDGSMLAVALADSTVKLINDRLSYPIILQGHTKSVTSMAWSPDGKLLATASADETVRVWDAQGFVQATLIGHGGPVNSVVWSPDGTLLVTGDDTAIKIWSPDGTLHSTFGSYRSPVLALAWSPDGKTIVSSWGDGFLCLWTNGQLESVRAGHSGPVLGLAWSHDGKLLASASEDRTVKLWDPSGRLVTTLEGYTAGISSIAWSPDDKVLAAGDRDGAIRVWKP